MMIIYIEKDRDAVSKRRNNLIRMLNPVIIKTAMTRIILLTSGLRIWVIDKTELERIRGVETLAVFINCHLEPYDRAGIEIGRAHV